MSRKGTARERKTPKDYLYGSVLVSKMINSIMLAGKKSIAEKIVYDALEKLKIEGDENKPIEIFHQSISNVMPKIEVRPQRVGGATYQIPTEVRERRAITLALRWIGLSAKARSGKSMTEKLTNELLDAYQNRGGAITTKENKRKMAEANKAFAHYRW